MGAVLTIDFGSTALFLRWRRYLLNRRIDYSIDFGHIKLKLNEVMDAKGISINMLSRLSDVKYDIVKKYYYGENYGCNFEILAKFCYILDCKLSDIIIYEDSKIDVK